MHPHTLDALEQANGRHGRKRPMKVKPYCLMQSRDLQTHLKQWFSTARVTFKIPI